MRLPDWLTRCFRKQTVLEMAAAELDEAERNKLNAQSTMESAKANVDYNSARIQRLRQFIETRTKEPTT